MRLNRDASTMTYTIDEAARLLGISRGLAYRLAREGRLPGVIPLGRRFVVSRAALEHLLAGDVSGRDGDRVQQALDQALAQAQDVSDGR
jgi:excisionase family DNA binding protein